MSWFESRRDTFRDADDLFSTVSQKSMDDLRKILFNLPRLYESLFG